MKDFKHREVVTARPNETVAKAIQKLVEYDRGSLPVVNDENKLIGILTERDIVRKCFALGVDPGKIEIHDIMTGEVAICIPEDDLDYAIGVMKQKRIRHLPIVEGRKIAGMISMRDLCAVQYEETKAEIRYSKLMPRRTGGPMY